ncbi:MAG: diaminopimelate dehydrogenase [Clostridia bacterium]|nr:diaminopimelate dehydrogenase [Clostridia bacterium]
MIRVGIYGYGNLGRGVEYAIRQNSDMELVAVFTRRQPETVKIKTEGVPVYHIDEAKNMTDKIDVMILCGGSATDLPQQTPEMAKYFNVIDSFDTHAKIPVHFENVDKAAKAASKAAIISVGWDPGMFSLNRMYAGAVLPEGKDYTFWGKGVSQGHSDAIRRIEGVKNAKQYTIPIDAALDAVRSGAMPELSTREKHLRECFVVARLRKQSRQCQIILQIMTQQFILYQKRNSCVTTVVFRMADLL